MGRLREDHPRLTKQAGPGELTQFAFDPFVGRGDQCWMVPFWQLGGEFHNPEGTKITIANERGIRALEWIMKLFNLQGGWPALEKAQAGSPRRAPLPPEQGLLHVRHLLHQGQRLQQGGPGLQVRLHGLPQPAGGKVANYAGGWAICIPKGAKNRTRIRLHRAPLRARERPKWHTFHLQCRCTCPWPGAPTSPATIPS